MDWTEKYRPQTLDDVVGNDTAIRDLREWAQEWPDEGRVVVLHGPPGIGKTSAAHALANDMGWEAIEMNASESRTKDKLQEVAGRASGNRSLRGGRRLIIVDEADNLHGNYDYGGKKALTEIVKSTDQPIVLIANDFYALSRGLRNNTEEIEFEHLEPKEIGKKLKDICEEEDIDYDFESLKRVAKNADGDIRGAINNLRAVAGHGGTIKGDFEASSREQEVGIFEYLDGLFQEYGPKEALDKAQSVDEDPESLIRWVEENMIRVYDDPEEVAQAYQHLANADVWLGRTRQNQEYRYWRYANNSMTAGVASARTQEHGGWTRYQPPKYISSGNYSDIVRKVAEKAGASMQTTRTEIMPFLSAMTHHCKPRDLTVQMAAYYDMNKSEVAEVTGSGKDTNKVASIVEDAQEMREEEIEVEPEEAQIPSPEERETVEPESEKVEEEVEEGVEEEVEETPEQESLQEVEEEVEAVADPPDDPDEGSDEEDGDEDDDEDEDNASLSDFM